MNLTELLNKLELFWQYPAITEKTFYEQEKNNPSYVGFPWATIIDKQMNFNTVLIIVLKYIIKNNKNKFYTCCQHISFRRLIPFWKKMGITTIYSPHKITGEDIINGITIKPCPLYAVSIEDNKRNKDINKSFKKTLLYSFIGSFSKYYISNIRQKIFELPLKNDIHIINRGAEWHFDPVVYSSKQNKNGELNLVNNHMKKTFEYNELLLKSKFTLAPSGTGPNSIRFWEALAVGSIPVLLADTLELPENKLWNKAILRVKESDIEKIDDILRKIPEDEIKERSKNCIELYNFYKNNFTNRNNKITLFTSYLCDIHDEYIQEILHNWKNLNPEYNILYFSDNDVKNFFKQTEYYNTYKQMKNGVAIADFFRICYINKYGGYWFDIDLKPTKIMLPNIGNINLFDVGYNNISYMFIGGKPNQKLFNDVIKNVNKNILENIKDKKSCVMEITGPRIIQNLILEKLNIINKDGCLIGTKNTKTYLKDTNYEFNYTKLDIKKHKTNIYNLLQKKYKKMKYSFYNYI